VMVGLGAGFSLLQSYTSNHYAGAVILLFCAVDWLGVQHLGYDEFEQARVMILNGGFRRALNSQLEVRVFRTNLNAAATPEAAWEFVIDAARHFGFLRVTWRCGSRTFTAETGEIGQHVWAIRIPLSPTDYMECTRGPSDEHLAVNIDLFAETVRAGLLHPEWDSIPEPATLLASRR